MTTVNAHFVNPFMLSDDWAEFDLILSGALNWRGAKTVARPISRASLEAYAELIVQSMTTEEAPLELGEVLVDLPAGMEID